MFKKLLVIAAAVAVIHGYATGLEGGRASSRQGDLNTYYLYTPASKNVAQLITVSGSGKITGFDRTIDTVVISHGLYGDAFSTLNPSVKNAFYNGGHNVNVIVVDWSMYSKQTYTIAVSAVPSVGAKLGEFLVSIQKRNRIDLTRVHLIGFGLGAHVVGIAGRTVIRLNEGPIGRITGLDPAASEWGSSSPRLTSSDALYVEVIHTDTAENGLAEVVGNKDFYVNGGSNQPGCSSNDCSHNRAWELFAATLMRDGKLWGNFCHEDSHLADDECRGFAVHLGGADLEKLGNGPGAYRVNTADRFPY